MRRLFFQIYASLGLVGLVTAGLIVLTAQPQPETSAKARTELLDRAHEVVPGQMRLALDPLSRARALQVISARVNGTAELLPLARVTAGLSMMDAERLNRGEAVMANFEGSAAPVAFFRMTDQPLVVVVRPDAPHDATQWRAAAALLVLLGGIGLSVYFTLRPLHLQLSALMDSARRFGEGQLDERAEVRGDDAAARLTQAFNEMGARVERLVRGREALLQAVAHELRTPVARVRFAVELLADTDDPEARMRRADKVQEDLEELDTLVSDLMNYASLNDAQKRLHREDIDLGATLQTLAADARTLKPKMQVTVTVTVAPTLTLSADLRLLKRALGNLLSNAVRYGDHKVSVMATDRLGGVAISIDDDGPGVPEADRQRVFDPLVRLDSARSRDTGGIGLGLALAWRIADAHGGTLKVTEGPLGGARFTLWLPTGPSA